MRAFFARSVAARPPGLIVGGDCLTVSMSNIAESASRHHDSATANPTWVAHFTPEAWVSDQAIEVDPQGPQTWDCAVFAQENLSYVEALVARNGNSVVDVLDNDDRFKDDSAAPVWVREWVGPFSIRLSRRNGQ